MGSQWNATWSLDSLVGWNDGELEKTLDHRNSYCMKWSLAYETLWNQAILTSNIFAQNLYWRSQGAIAGTGSMPPWHDRLDKPAVTWCSYYWTIAIISKLRPDMISSLEKDPTFPHQTTSQRSERSAFGPDQFVARHWSFGDLQHVTHVTCKLVLFLRFSWGEAVPAES